MYTEIHRSYPSSLCDIIEIQQSIRLVMTHPIPLLSVNVVHLQGQRGYLFAFVKDLTTRMRVSAHRFPARISLTASPGKSCKANRGQAIVSWSMHAAVKRFWILRDECGWSNAPRQKPTGNTSGGRSWPSCRMCPPLGFVDIFRCHVGLVALPSPPFSSQTLLCHSEWHNVFLWAPTTPEFSGNMKFENFLS